VALDSYSNLKASIADHLDRDDLTSFVDDFIDLAETRHKRDIRLRESITREAITIDARYENFPTGFLEGISFRLLTDPVTPLQYVPPEDMARYREESTGKPRFYTLLGTQFEFDKTPDSSYSGEVLFHKAATPLSDSNTSNAILVRAPDAYLYGSLLASAPFLQHDERIEVWAALYKSAVDALKQAARQDRYSGRLVSRVYGDNP
jgi:hypothetical protein